jgi:hypothetical protein
MAGAVRQPIDIASLERYIADKVPEIKVPIDVKQVRRLKHEKSWSNFLALEAQLRGANGFGDSLDMGSQILPTS